MSVSRHVASRMILTLAVFNMPLGIDLFNVHKSDRKPYPPQTVREAEVREEVWV